MAFRVEGKHSAFVSVAKLIEYISAFHNKRCPVECTVFGFCVCSYGIFFVHATFHDGMALNASIAEEQINIIV